MTNKIFMLLILFAAHLFSSSLTKEQLQTLQLVMDNAKIYADYKGEEYPKTMAAICLGESSGGKDKDKQGRIIGDVDKKDKENLAKASLGIMQIRVDTVKYVAKYYDIKPVLKMSDEDIVNHLLNNKTFSARIATLYFILNMNKFKNYFTAISTYNGGTKNYVYVNRILKRLKTVNRLIKEGKLRL